MSEWLKVVLLGVVEGVTEFLPISSTGHLIIATALVGGFERVSLKGTFEIFIQLGAVLAVVGFYRADFIRQIRQVRRDKSIQRLWLALVIASFPAALLGLMLGGLIEQTLFTPVVVALSLIFGGIMFLVVERRPVVPLEVLTTDLTAITVRQALLVGLAQTVALIPGVSRSGASIVGAMLAGMNRTTATVFSFYLAVPTLGGATVYTLLRKLDQLKSGDVLKLLLGAAVSFVVAWLAMEWLLHYVARNRFTAFGIYRILIGAAVLVLLATSHPTP